MAKAVQDAPSFLTGSAAPETETELRLPATAQHAITFLLVATAAFLAFVASSVVPDPGLTLIFVLPVVIASTTFGLGPSLAAIVTGILAFDFFFTKPYLTLSMTEPSDIWAAGLLLITQELVPYA